MQKKKTIRCTAYILMLYVQYFILRKPSSVLTDTHLIGVPSAKTQSRKTHVFRFHNQKETQLPSDDPIRLLTASVLPFTCSRMTPLEVCTKQSEHPTTLSSDSFIQLRCLAAWAHDSFIIYMIVDIFSYRLSRMHVYGRMISVPSEYQG